MADNQHVVHARIELHPPTLQEIVPVLNEHLSRLYDTVTVGVETCPDLTREHGCTRYAGSPFCLLRPGLGDAHNKAMVADVGGVGNLFPQIRKRVYNIRSVCAACGLANADSTFVIGPGAGPFLDVGVNSEMMCNCCCTPARVDASTWIAKIDPSTQASKVCQVASADFALMANLLLTNGQPGDVLKVNVKCRTDKSATKISITEEIRAILKAHYKDKHVCMAGVLVVNSGTITVHVMPELPDENWSCIKAIEDEWLKYFDIHAPFAAHTVFHTDDYVHEGKEHTHGYNAASSTDGGHYHYDISPTTVEYTLYLVAAHTLVRVDMC